MGGSRDSDGGEEENRDVQRTKKNNGGVKKKRKEWERELKTERNLKAKCFDRKNNN